jgi:hypothetical protein
MLTLMLCVLGCNSLLAGEQSNRKKEIEDAINNFPLSDAAEGNGDLPSSYISQFKASDVSIIYDIAFDTTNRNPKRNLAIYLPIYLDPDQAQLDRITQFVVDNIPTYNYTDKTGDGLVVQARNTLVELYKKTKRDKLLKPFGKLYFNDEICSKGCRFSILMLLTKTDSVQNVDLYNQILANSNSTRAERAWAALGLAESGKVEALSYLSEMANHLFDKIEDPSGDEYLIYAIPKIGGLSAKHYVAAKELQDLITHVCEIDANDYGYVMKPTLRGDSPYVVDLFKASQVNDQEGNRRYFEKLLGDGCSYPNAKRLTIQTLGFIGNEETITLLNQYADVYPNFVSIAISQIQQKLGIKPVE